MAKPLRFLLLACSFRLTRAVVTYNHTRQLHLVRSADAKRIVHAEDSYRWARATELSAVMSRAVTEVREGGSLSAQMTCTLMDIGLTVPIGPTGEVHLDRQASLALLLAKDNARRMAESQRDLQDIDRECRRFDGALDAPSGGRGGVLYIVTPKPGAVINPVELRVRLSISRSWHRQFRFLAHGVPIQLEQVAQSEGDDGRMLVTFEPPNRGSSKLGIGLITLSVETQDGDVVDAVEIHLARADCSQPALRARILSPKLVHVAATAALGVVYIDGREWAAFADEIALVIVTSVTTAKSERPADVDEVEAGSDVHTNNFNVTRVMLPPGVHTIAVAAMDSWMHPCEQHVAGTTPSHFEPRVIRLDLHAAQPPALSFEGDWPLQEGAPPDRPVSFSSFECVGADGVLHPSPYSRSCWFRDICYRPSDQAFVYFDDGYSLPAIFDHVSRNTSFPPDLLALNVFGAAAPLRLFVPQTVREPLPRTPSVHWWHRPLNVVLEQTGAENFGHYIGDNLFAIFMLLYTFELLSPHVQVWLSNDCHEWLYTAFWLPSDRHPQLLRDCVRFHSHMYSAISAVPPLVLHKHLFPSTELVCFENVLVGAAGFSYRLHNEGKAPVLARYRRHLLAMLSVHTHVMDRARRLHLTLQFRSSAWRRIVNGCELVIAITDAIRNVDLTVVHDGSLSLSELAQQMAKTNVLVTQAGGSSFIAIFASDGAAVVFIDVWQGQGPRGGDRATRRHEEPRFWSHAAWFRDVYYTPTDAEIVNPDAGLDSDTRIECSRMIELLNRTLHAVRMGQAARQHARKRLA
jgi:hypothetical protein